MGVLRGRNWPCILVPRFLGLNIENFGISSRQSRTMLRFGFDPETDIFGFYLVFWNHSDSVMNETKTGSW